MADPISVKDLDSRLNNVNKSTILYNNLQTSF